MAKKEHQKFVDVLLEQISESERPGLRKGLETVEAALVKHLGLQGPGLQSAVKAAFMAWGSARGLVVNQPDPIKGQKVLGGTIRIPREEAVNAAYCRATPESLDASIAMLERAAALVVSGSCFPELAGSMAKHLLELRGDMVALSPREDGEAGEVRAAREAAFSTVKEAVRKSLEVSCTLWSRVVMFDLEFDYHEELPELIVADVCKDPFDESEARDSFMDLGQPFEVTHDIWPTINDEISARSARGDVEAFDELLAARSARARLAKSAQDLTNHKNVWSKWREDLHFFALAIAELEGQKDIGREELEKRARKLSLAKHRQYLKSKGRKMGEASKQGRNHRLKLDELVRFNAELANYKPD